MAFTVQKREQGSRKWEDIGEFDELDPAIAKALATEKHQQHGVQTAGDVFARVIQRHGIGRSAYVTLWS